MSHHHKDHGKKHRGGSDRPLGCAHTECAAPPGSCRVPSSAKKHWKNLRYEPWAEPEAENELKHRQWRHEYKHWTAICLCPCKRGYYCRPHGEWVRGNQTKDEFQKERDEFGYPDCPPNHPINKSQQGPTEELNGIQGLTLRPEHDVLPSSGGQELTWHDYPDEDQDDQGPYSGPYQGIDANPQISDSFPPTFPPKMSRPSHESSYKGRHSPSVGAPDGSGKLRSKTKSHRSGHERGSKTKAVPPPPPASLPFTTQQQTTPGHDQGGYNYVLANPGQGNEPGGYPQPSATPVYNAYGTSYQEDGQGYGHLFGNRHGNYEVN